MPGNKSETILLTAKELQDMVEFQRKIFINPLDFVKNLQKEVK